MIRSLIRQVPQFQRNLVFLSSNPEDEGSNFLWKYWYLSSQTTWHYIQENHNLELLGYRRSEAHIYRVFHVLWTLLQEVIS